MMQDEVIVERSFALGGEEVHCRFFRPRFDGQDYGCKYEIDWPDRQQSAEIWGVDGVQALLLAMRSAHGALTLRGEQAALPLRWLGEEALGLPPHSDSKSDWTTGNPANSYAFFLNSLSAVMSDAAQGYSDKGQALLRQAWEAFMVEFRRRHPYHGDQPEDSRR
jgi:hypothetical protein